jgi:hypothetical protein
VPLFSVPAVTALFSLLFELSVSLLAEVPAATVVLSDFVFSVAVAEVDAEGDVGLVDELSEAVSVTPHDVIAERNVSIARQATIFFIIYQLSFHDRLSF